MTKKTKKFSQMVLTSVLTEIRTILAIATKYARKGETQKMEEKIHQAKTWARDYSLRIQSLIRKVRLAMKEETNNLLAAAKEHAKNGEIKKMEEKIRQAKVLAKETVHNINLRIYEIRRQTPAGNHLDISLKVVA